MPSFDKFLVEIKANNKTLFNSEKIQIKTKSLEGQLERAFHAGFKYCEELKENIKNSNKEDYDSLNIFKDIFGKK